MVKLNFLNLNGEIVTKSPKDLGTTWIVMNTIQTDYPMTKEEKLFLEKYGLQTTIFNVANLRHFGYIQLYPYWVDIALSHGAIDRREK
jgi:hypothetical protein